MNTYTFFYLALFSIFTFRLQGSGYRIPDPTTEKCAKSDSNPKKSQNVSICFWNIENLYDTADDSTTQDEEFTPEGLRHWNYSRYSTKLNHLAKAILAMGRWEPPAVVGLCEVENRKVLNHLTRYSPLSRFGYRIEHFDSPDRRGVDVALLYRPGVFRVTGARPITICFPFATEARTRDILMVTGLLWERDTLTLFVNHWPSRRGGKTGSQPRRTWVAGVLRHLVDSILQVRANANILIMGDFNDEPDDESLKTTLGAQTGPLNMQKGALFNLMSSKMGREGTHCYRGEWAILDQFIVSEALLSGKSGIATGGESVTIFKPAFMVTEDNSWLGTKPRRSFNGPAYEGGFSDHLPITVELERK